MAIDNNRNLLEQQILSNSGLKGKELENLKARLATLSKQQLQAELSKLLSGNNKGEWYTGITLEHSESVVIKSNHETKTFTDENGNEISELRGGDEVFERTIKSTDENGNVYITTVTFQSGKPLTQTKTKNGNTIETTTYRYNDDADVPFVTVETKKADQSKVMTNVLEIDENGNFDNEDFIDRQTTSIDGTTTHIFTENNCVIEQQVKPNGKKVDTLYKGDSIEDYDNKKLHRVYQRTELNGEVHEVAYDGNGNTRTVVQNGESPSVIAKKFGVKESSLLKLNPARGKNAITQVGADIVVPGEYNADSRVMKTRKTKQGAMQDYANDEVQRTVERLYSSTMQEVTLDKDYKDAYSYARALLVADGIKNPSNQQVNNKANEILVANGNIKFTKGTKVQIAAKTTNSKLVQDLSNNGFKPTRENAIFYNKFNALNPSQQQNVLSVIKYCRSQKITDPNKIKARILETFPDINLFDSGKLIPMNSSFGTPVFQRKNPVALETFLTDTLKLDLKSETGKMVYERLSSLPQDELNKINGRNFADMSKANFVEIANSFETNGVNIRTGIENQMEQNARVQRAERLGIPQQKFTSEMLANIYDRAADMLEQYYHNHGVFDAGTYLEGMKNLMDLVTPDNIFGIDMRSTLHVASDCRKAAERFRQMHTDNPETFKREYAQLKKDGLVTADYNRQNIQEFMHLIQSGEVDINSDKFKNACQKAFGFKGVENTEKYIQTGEMAGNIGDIVIMLYTLGAASELKMMGKATTGVYGALERGTGKIMSKTAAQKTAKVGTSMLMGGTTLGGFTLGKETLNNLSNPMRDATSWETWKQIGIASAESFGFGAFGGLLNETVVAPIVKAIEKPATKATQAVSKALTEQGELTGKQIMDAVSESGSLKLDGLFKMNSQEWANLARTATAKGVGFGVEVTGFTAYEAGLDTIKDLIDPQTGRLPDNITVESLTEYLGEKFGEQFSNLGTIKGISQLLMMSKGGKVAQKAMMNEILSKSEALKDIKFKKVEINGHEVYEVTYPNGNRAVVSSPEQAIATCQMAMQMEFLAKSLNEVETPKGKLNNVKEASTTNPAENAEAKILSEVARTEFKDEGMRLNTSESLDVELAEVERNPNAPVDNLETLSLVINGKLGKTLKSQYEKAGQVFEEIITKNADKILKLEQKYKNNKEQLAIEFTQLIAEQIGVKGIEPKIEFVDPKDAGAAGYFNWTTGKLLINKELKNPKDIETIIAHEFVHVMQFKDVVAARGEDAIRDIYTKNNDGKYLEAKTREWLKEEYELDYDKEAPKDQELYRNAVLDALVKSTVEANDGLIKFAQEHPLEKGSLNEYLSRIYQAENENMATFDTPEYYSQVIENEAYFLGNGRAGSKINADTKLATALTKHANPRKTSEDGIVIPAGKFWNGNLFAKGKNFLGIGNQSETLNKYKTTPNFSLNAKNIVVTDSQLNKIYKGVYDLYIQKGRNKETAKILADDYLNDLKRDLNNNPQAKEHFAWMMEHQDLFGNITTRNIRDGWNEYFSKDQHTTGWKMHLFADTEMDWRTMSEVVIPYLKDHGVNWKTVDEIQGVTELYDSQAGKAFTIYPKSNEEMAQIAQDLDYIIRNNNLVRQNSNIEGDRQLGSTGRLFYRYEWKSGRYKDEVLDLSKQSDSDACDSRYDENRGIDPVTGESRYLANDMTSADDIWLNFDPSSGHSKVNLNATNNQAQIIKLQANQRYEINEFPVLKLADYELDLNQPRIRQALESLVEGQRITVGREGNIKISADNPHISRQHAIIEKHNGKLYVIDNNSTNGTSIITKNSQTTPQKQQYTLKNIVDENIGVTPQAIIEKRFSIRNYLEKNFPYEFNKIINKVGNNYAYKIKWEEIINKNSTLEQDKALLNEIYKNL